MANYKKPTLMMILFSIVICSVVVACFGTSKPSETTETEETIFALEELESETIQKVASITNINVQLEDLEILETARTELRNALRNNNYNDDAKETINSEIERINQIIKIINQVQLVQKRIKQLPSPFDISNEDHYFAVEMAEIAYNALSEYGKTFISETDVTTIYDYVNAFKDYSIKNIHIAISNSRSAIESNVWSLHPNDLNYYGITFTLNGVCSKLTQMTVNGKKIHFDLNKDSYSGFAAYASTSNGTSYVLLKAEYLNLQEPGEYTITFTFKDGELSTLFYIVDTLEHPELPEEPVVPAPEKPKPEGSYVYPIRPGTEEWYALTNFQRHEVCQIPQEILDNMNNEQLIQATLDYPFLIDVFWFLPRSNQVKKAEHLCSSYAELLSRDLEQAKNDYIVYMQKYCVPADEAVEYDDVIKNSYLVTLILCQEKFKAILTEEDKAIIQIYNRFHGEIV